MIIRDLLPNQQEMEQMWVNKVRPALGELFLGQCQIVEVKAHFQQNCLSIMALYGQNTEAILNYSPGPVGIYAFGCGIVNGSPKLQIFMPVIQKCISRVVELKQDNTEAVTQMIKSFVWIGFLHETDHLALKIVDSNPTLEQIVNGEAKVWGRTCSKIIYPLVQTHKWELHPAWLPYYQNWVKCGMNAENSQWKNFIASLYGQPKQV